MKSSLGHCYDPDDLLQQSFPSGPAAFASPHVLRFARSFTCIPFYPNLAFFNQLDMRTQNSRFSYFSDSGFTNHAHAIDWSSSFQQSMNQLPYAYRYVDSDAVLAEPRAELAHGVFNESVACVHLARLCFLSHSRKRYLHGRASEYRGGPCARRRVCIATGTNSCGTNKYYHSSCSYYKKRRCVQDVFLTPMFSNSRRFTTFVCRTPHEVCHRLCWTPRHRNDRIRENNFHSLYTLLLALQNVVEHMRLDCDNFLQVRIIHRVTDAIICKTFIVARYGIRRLAMCSH